MITFACDHCGKQYTLNPEFAGRSTRCSGCKLPLVVPSPPTPQPESPPVVGRIQGTKSSLAQAGVDAGVTLAGDFATAEALSLHNLIDGKAGDGARYVVERELARGGMGAVMRAVDCDIRREVAVKYLLDQGDARKKLRFVEEAQITGQLEHPNIVPIHELGVDAEKRIFFSMKMVKGRSLAAILKSLANEPQAEKEFGQGKLLNVFVNVCNALAYAHARGVVHRDLKPANIMIGDFGEVYVMDWGLAKVLARGTSATATGPVTAIPVARLVSTEPFDFASPVPEATPIATPVAASSETVAQSGSPRIVTSRDSEGDLTRDGAVLGTPVYMPPEQATGKIHEIDERSDVYSMGAILYEILALHPPIGKEGGYWPILMRVTQGQIEPPEKRAPERARAGKIPPELAAIAMKALAKRKEDRYPSVALLRTDIERYLEGRSVSAKQDTLRETAVKLIKRNKGVSIATAAASFVLGVLALWFLIAILAANARIRSANDALLAAEASRLDHAKKSVPSFVRAARLLIGESQFEDALTQLDNALAIDDYHVDAHLLRGELLLVRQDYLGARKELEKCLMLKRDRDDAKALLGLAINARANNTDTLLALAEELTRQKAYTLAEPVTRQAAKLLDSREKLLAHYRTRLDDAWRLGPCLIFDPAGDLRFEPPDDGVLSRKVSDLSPLRGLPLQILSCRGLPNIRDLGPLKIMPLKHLDLAGCRGLSDLSVLQGMQQLESLNLSGCSSVSDLSPLTGVPLTTLVLAECTQVRDLRPLTAMPLKKLVLVQCSLIEDLGPLKSMPLETLDLTYCGRISDLKPLKGMPLKWLSLDGGAGQSQVTDITPLQGMKLERLSLRWCTQVSDLSALAGATSVVHLNLNMCGIRDVKALQGMPLERLNLSACRALTDLRGLEGMLLTELDLSDCSKLADLRPLKGMPLTFLDLHDSSWIHDLAPLTGMPLTYLNLKGCNKIESLAPLKSLRGLNVLSLTGLQVGDLESLRGIPLKTLELRECARLMDLSAIRDTKLTSLILDQCQALTNLAPLTGMELQVLSVSGSLVKDLSPLRDMPIHNLNLANCAELHDLTPLAGMPLTEVILPPKVVLGMDAIRKMTSLLTINGENAQQFWRKWDAAQGKSK
jgi:serine/threonine protein kinase